MRCLTGKICPSRGQGANLSNDNVPILRGFDQDEDTDRVIENLSRLPFETGSTCPHPSRVSE